jgi:hypothetical protein
LSIVLSLYPLQKVYCVPFLFLVNSLQSNELCKIDLGHRRRGCAKCALDLCLPLSDHRGHTPCNSPVMYGQYQGSNRPHNTGQHTASRAPSSYQPPSYSAAHASQYAQMYQSPHYAAAYGQAQAITGTSSLPLTDFHPSTRTQPKFFTPPPNSSSWYSPGTCRCTYQDCNFIGSAKSLEVHRMDRHLIYPPGWKERKKRLDWDADPSLIGYDSSHVFLHYTTYMTQEADTRARHWSHSRYAGQD